MIEPLNMNIDPVFRAENIPIAACRDHGRPGSPCTLDLVALRARTKEVEALREAMRGATFQNLEKLRRELAEIGARNVTAAQSAAHRELRTQALERARLDAELPLLYATRAHHRGRVHDHHAARWRHIETLTSDELTMRYGPSREGRWYDFIRRVWTLLPYQTDEIRATWAKFSRRAPKAVSTAK